MSKTVQTLGHLHSFHTTKVKCKILQASLQQYLNHNFLVFKLGLEKLAEPETIANIHQIIEKTRELQKNIYLCFIDCAKVSDCVDHNKLENS